MNNFEDYKVHIQYTFNAFCKVVIRHAAIDKILNLHTQHSGAAYPACLAATTAAHGGKRP